MKKLTPLLLFAWLLTIGTGCSKDDANPVSPTSSGSITGLVTGGAAGSPVTGATISTIPSTRTVTTDSVGRYSLSDVAAGTYAVKVSMPGFADAIDTANVAGGATDTVNFRLVVGTSGSGDSLRAPSNPTPTDGAPGQPVYVVLSWAASGPATDSVKYDLYFGTTQAPELLVADLDQPNNIRSGLDTGVTYYWRVVARNRKGETKSGPVWTFSTSTLLNNRAPVAPNTPNPANGASSQPYSINFRWNSSDPDGDALTYDIYLGTSNALSESDRISSGQSAATFSRSNLAEGTTYYWRVVARDNHNGVSPGPIWSFTVRTNLAPNRPSQPTPANGAVDVSTSVLMRWTATDDDADPLKYDIYLGTGSDASNLVASDVTVSSYNAAALQPSTTYFWKVVAKDGLGGATAGPVWSFTTADPVAVGLVAYYPLDGNASDASGHGHNGQVSGPVPTTDRYGAPNSAMRFMSQSYIEVPHSDELSFGSSDFSTLAWVRYSGSQSAYAGIVVKCTPQFPEYGYQFVASGYALAGQIGTTQGYFDFDGSKNLNDGNWHFVAMVVTRSTRTAKLYIDGTLVREYQNTKLASSIYSTSPLFLGQDRQGGSHFVGSIDDVRLYNVALTQEQIQEIGAE
jgi:hypothetical protein